jgi:radical SAM protein with 4Fe4S-binding SPASM domain
MKNNEILNKMVNIETINKCNAHCLICPRDAFKPKLESMDFDLFKKIIDGCIKYNTEVINLCGFGEPLLDTLFFKRCEYVKEKLPNSKIYMSTNASLLTEKYYDSIIKYIDIIKFSIFGMSEETYKIMHKLNFYKCFINIIDFLKYKENIDTNIYTSGLFVETEINKHERNEWIDFWEPLLSEVYVWKPHNWLNLKYREININNQISCNRPFSTFYIHANGDVGCCCYDINKGIVLGNLETQTFEDIMESKELKKVQMQHYNNFFDDLICKNCDQTCQSDDNLIYSNKNRKIGMYAYEVNK